MNLKDLFKKPVDRPIEGVIKADDEAQLRLEIEEYVLTNEIEARLENFFDAYRNYSGANGAWISGFFGSGKSHLLKMLALILENREIDGKRAIDLFLPKCEKNQILYGDIKSSAQIPSRSILFNIDQRSDVISKTQIDALLSVFLKVFNEACGYYGKHGYIADFERDLDTRGLYNEFKTTYAETAKIPWERGREQALLETQNISKAYAAVMKVPDNAAAGILDKYRHQHKVSIEDFGDMVKNYINRMPAKFRLNFFVDEVGQYIAENVKLMTNLQTIAETLATKCNGRAWIIVTAQEDMNTVTGEMGKQQSNDFSKIQARFKNRLKLTSTDVAEVIQKRLLAKNEQGIEALSSIYHEQQNNFRTFFDFSDGAQSYRNYNDRDHFIYCYPFIPYQFTLFQTAIQNLSAHNAFEGKHSSVGERSMLGVFQHVARHVSEHTTGQLATFDLMFEGIRTALKSNIQRSVLNAEKNLSNKLAIKLLKALFLVKYVKEFKASVRNLCILVFDNFDRKLPELKKEVEEALAYLEQQTYIQRNGEFYEFLTDEEKDIEQEIKNTDIENEAVISEIEKIVFEHIVRDRKLKFEDNGQDFPYSKKIDQNLRGREYELAIDIITPFIGQNIDKAGLCLDSASKNEVMVILPQDDRLIRYLTLYKKTEKYIRQQNSSALNESAKRIINDKGVRNCERYKEIERLFVELMANAEIVVGGNMVTAQGEPRAKIERGFSELIRRVYTNLKMLKNEQYSENLISGLLKKNRDDMFKNETASLSEPMQEVLSHIQNTGRTGTRVTIKNVLENFEKKPYGWSNWAVLCTLANLFSFGKIELRSGGNQLEGEEIERALTNIREHANIVIDPQIEFTASQVRRLKTFFEDFFNLPPCANEAKALGAETSEKFKKMAAELNEYINQKENYPFLNSLVPAVETVSEMCGKPYAWYFSEISKHEEKLLDLKERIIDPIKNFMGGAQKGIYESAFIFINGEKANIEYIETEDAKRILAILNDPECYRGRNLQQLKTLADSLAEKVAERLAKEKEKACAIVTSLSDDFTSTAQFSKFKPELADMFQNKIRGILSRINESKIISAVRDTARRFEEKGLADIVSEISALIKPEPKIIEIEKSTGSKDTQPAIRPEKEQTGQVHPPGTMELVNKNSIHIELNKRFLATTEDVECYTRLLKEKMLEMVKSGKTIQI
ncbi:MAG: BREX system P-loop protein BrxC [Candidatus Wallbacteria bacterium]